MSGNKKTSAIKTPLAFKPLPLPEIEETEAEDEEFSDEMIAKMRKILKGYEELNKLCDLCIQRIQSRHHDE